MKNFKLPELVIFDMDGTMLDTEPLALEGWHISAQNQGIDITFEAFAKIFEKVVGRNQTHCRQIMLDNLGADFDFEAGYNFYLSHIDAHFEKHGAPLKSGLLPLLDKLEEMNIKKCVATSTAKERATHKLAKSDLIHRFEIIVGGDEVAHSKPDPEIFLKAAKACNTLPKNCLVIEDSIAGTEGGFYAGMRVILIPDTQQPSVQTRRMAWAVCSSLDEVTSLFRSLQTL